MMEQATCSPQIQVSTTTTAEEEEDPQDRASTTTETSKTPTDLRTTAAVAGTGVVVLWAETPVEIRATLQGTPRGMTATEIIGGTAEAGGMMRMKVLEDVVPPPHLASPLFSLLMWAL